MTAGNYIEIKNCRVADARRDYLRNISWKYSKGQTWLVTGGSKSGKEHFAAALAQSLLIIPEESGGSFESAFLQKSALVSLENAAVLIAEERRRDESDYVEGGVDIGRTARAYIGEILKNGFDAACLEELSEVKLTGIEHILDRGLKYLSTGEIRRVLLTRALLSNKGLLVFSEPFAGLDCESQKILFEFFDALAAKESDSLPRLILCVDRYQNVPDSVNAVLEFSGGKISFNGTRADYESLLDTRQKNAEDNVSSVLFKESARAWTRQRQIESAEAKDTHKKAREEILVDMQNVNVAWGDNHVIRSLTWRVLRGEHWFIRGPNGSGKTTLLELITGDNMQVFSNHVAVFGAKRGSGETLWDIRKKLGIVSYRLHLEYRMVGGTPLEDVVVSGFHDSIGLYEPKTELEKIAARKWLALAGFAGRENEAFSSLSYGEQRAALIIRATVKCAPLLILDEPCHALDEQSRSMTLELLKTIAEEGCSTMLHITHDPLEMQPFEKHILELRPEQNPMYAILNG
jgi:molybdate transport system ATP-binding protein